MKWHKEGVYAVRFAEVLDGEKETKEGEKVGESGEGGKGGKGGEMVKKMGTMTVAEKRIKQATQTHWIAVGGKDGKVSLWDIY